MTIKHTKASLLTFAAMMTALTTLATLFFKIPVGLGYIHFGDTFVILAALLLPRKYACFSAGAGAALADILGGFAVWAPWSLVIKVIVVLLIQGVAHTPETLLDRSSEENTQPGALQSHTAVKRAIAVGLAAAWTAASYYAAEGFMYGNWVAPFAGIPFNLLQVAVGAAIALVLGKALKHVI